MRMGDNVSLLMWGGSKQIDPMLKLEADNLFWYDLENFVKAKYPGMKSSEIEEVKNAFCASMPGYKMTYGPDFVEKAIKHLFF